MVLGTQTLKNNKSALELTHLALTGISGYNWLGVGWQAR